MSNRRAQDERIEGTPDGSNAITEISDIPDTPTIGTATAGLNSASITFTPATTGGTASLFTATSSPGSITGTSATSPITVSGLIAGTTYTFTVRGSNSTGTSPASSASNSIIPADLVGSYDALSTITVPAGGVATITFTGIPTGYRHLQVRWLSRNDSAAYYVANRFNNDTTASYAYHRLVGNGAAASATGAGSEAQIYNTPQSATASIFGVGVMDILDYSNLSKFKTTRTLGGWDENGSGRVELVSGLWQKTDAINRIDFFAFAGSFTQHSQFALYGVR